jgi:hypothetical protein
VAYSDGKTITWNVKPLSTGATSYVPSVSGSKSPIVILSKDLVGEKVVIKNTGSSDVNMTGWKILSVQGNQVFYFPTNFILKHGETVTIMSGKNAYNAPPKVLKWTTSNIWNNDGDEARLIDPNGKVVSTK